MKKKSVHNVKLDIKNIKNMLFYDTSSLKEKVG